MKILSWNINGIRAVIKKGFLDWLKKDSPDVVCVQEIKIAELARKKELDEVLKSELKNYDVYWNSAIRPGYSGTATFVKKKIKNITVLERLKWDDEGRVQVFDMGQFYLSNVYFPNANNQLSRLGFKIEFNDRLLRLYKKLEKTKPVVVCGDYNVAHNEIDLARPKANVGSPGFTDEERAWMTKFLSKGFVDVFRAQHGMQVKYSWWSYRANARVRNVGWRIDYFCVSEGFVKNIKKSFILNEVMGSDHCPVGLEIK